MGVGFATGAQARQQPDHND
ncbi:hypothetical protein HaLaN_11088, partial [Haematococcus lacustris]